jgi:ATP-dependent Zn protease
MSPAGVARIRKALLNDISTGASNDIQRSTICRKMITPYGMSDKPGPSPSEPGHDECFYGATSRSA